jgi:D-amino-acid dehydrogenase
VRVVVIGGGVVGLAVAAALVDHGATVVVLDEGRVGQGASAGNAGWITPVLSEPLSAPGVHWQAMRWMANPSSPFLMRPVPRGSYLRWLYRFWRSTAPWRYQAGMAALVALTDEAHSSFDRLAEAGVEFEMHCDGMLFVARGERAVAREASAIDAQRAHGYRGAFEQLSGSEARDLEPALGEGVVAALYARGERHVRPESLVRGLVAHLAALGVSMRENVRACAVRRSGGQWVVDDPTGEIDRADKLVVAAGVGSRRLLASVGVPLPVEGAKGYSVTFETMGLAPSRPVYMLETKVGFSPFNSAARLAGTLELGSDHTRLNERRVAALESSARRYFRTWNPGRAGRSWAGLRPLTPDGLPVIGPVPGHEGLFVATGHGMLGVTLAPVTGELLAPAVVDGRASLTLSAFSIARFSAQTFTTEKQAAQRTNSPASAGYSYPTFPRR